MQKSFLFSILEEISPNLNTKVFNFPDNVHGGYLILANSNIHYFKSSRWDVNPLGGSKVVTDKTLTLKILKDNKYNIPKGILLEEFDIPLIKSLIFPVVVKPNSEYRARGLSLVENLLDIDRAFLLAKSFEKFIRIEEVVEGKHMSFGVFNNRVYFAYEKQAFSSGEIVNDYTDVLNEEIKEYIGKIPSIFNLKLASIDCVYRGEGDKFNPNNLVIIEVNSAPSFRKYGEYSDKTRENVKLLYTDLIKFISN